MNASSTKNLTARLSAAALIVGILGVTASAVARTEPNTGRDFVVTMQAEAPVDGPKVDGATELPREWRWQREAVSFDSMYRR